MKKILTLTLLSLFVFACSTDDNKKEDNNSRNYNDILIQSSPWYFSTNSIINILENSNPEIHPAGFKEELGKFLKSSSKLHFSEDNMLTYTDAYNHSLTYQYDYVNNDTFEDIITLDNYIFFANPMEIIGIDESNLYLRTEIKLTFDEENLNDDVTAYVNLKFKSK